MYAVIKTGGKQYRVVVDDILDIEKIAGEAGSMVSFENVLMISGEGAPTVGSPMIEGATVTAEVLGQKRASKIIVFKKKRRKNYRRKNGHRQELTRVKILEVLAKGQAATKEASGKAPVKKVPGAKNAATGGSFELLKAPQGKADEIEFLDGVGPALEKKLAEYGIFHFSQLVAMSADDIKKMEDKLSLGGRFEREEWAQQAQELMDGKPPRAASDRKDWEAKKAAEVKKADEAKEDDK